MVIVLYAVVKMRCNMRLGKLNNIFSALALILFVIIGGMVRNSSEGILLDTALLQYIHNNINPIVVSIMKFISFVGSGYFLVPIITLIFIYTLIKKNYYISKILLASSLGCWIFNYVLKILFNRTRPLDFFLVEQGGLSYPSGHSMVSMSMYLSFAYLISRNEIFKDKKKIVYSFALIDVLLMGASRIYLGVHWPTDIIGGFIMGYLFFRFVVATIKE